MADALLILTALADEAAPIARDLHLARQDRGAWSGSVGGRVVRLRVTGVGGERAVAGLDRAIADGGPAAAVWLAGVAGGLAPELETGDLVEPASVVDGDGAGFHLATDRPPAPLTADDAPDEPRLLTVDRIVASPKAKAALRKRTGAAIVDMEGLALATTAADRALPLRIIRAVSDPADRSVPAAAAGWVRPDGTADRAAAAAGLARRPWLAPAVARLGRDFGRATDAAAARTAVLVTA